MSLEGCTLCTTFTFVESQLSMPVECNPSRIVNTVNKLEESFMHSSLCGICLSHIPHDITHAWATQQSQWSAEENKIVDSTPEISEQHY